MDTEKPVVTVVSCSMYPHYDVGEVILVQGQDFENIEEGDIAVYESGDPGQSIPVIHRVVSKTRIIWKLKATIIMGSYILKVV